MTQKLMEIAHEKAFNHFKKQYGTNNFLILKENVENNIYSWDLFQKCDIINLPEAEKLLHICMKIDYINKTTYCENCTPFEFEKKNDYLYYSALILLNEWSEKYLPELLLQNTLDTTMVIMKDSVWMRIGEICNRLGEIYDELEENYK